MANVISGGCLCGGVTYELAGPLRPVVACHCNQCRKSSGHYVAATQVPVERASIRGDTLSWFRSSEQAERGFCATCGSNLFWREIGGSRISVMAGSLEGRTGLRIESQLYAESAGDYYDLPDVPIIEQSSLK